MCIRLTLCTVAILALTLSAPAAYLTDYSAPGTLQITDPDDPAILDAQDILSVFHSIDAGWHYFRIDLQAAPTMTPPPGEYAGLYSVYIDNAPGGAIAANWNYVPYDIGDGVDYILDLHYDPFLGGYHDFHLHVWDGATFITNGLPLYQYTENGGTTLELAVQASTIGLEFTWAAASHDQGSAVETYDRTPWQDGTANATINLQPARDCFTDNLYVNITAEDMNRFIAGGQFTLTYDNTNLTFLSADPGDGLWTELYEVVNPTAGTIDYAVNAPYGDPGTDQSTVMAVLTFEIDSAFPDNCGVADLVQWRPHDPPTRLTTPDGLPVYGPQIDLPAVMIDRTAPTVSNVQLTGANVDADCETVVSFSGVITDNCCIPEENIVVDLVVTTGNADLDTPTITLTPNAGNGYDITGSALVSNLTSCPATLQWTVYAVDCCGNAAGTDATAPLAGRWSESSLTGSPGQPGNLLHAGSWDGAALYTQWEITDAAIENAQITENNVDPWGKGERIIVTNYTGGTINVDAALWGDAGMVSADIVYNRHVTHQQFLAGNIVGSYTDVRIHARVNDDLGITATARAVLTGEGSALPADYPAFLGGGTEGLWGEITEIRFTTVDIGTGDVHDIEDPVIWWDLDGGTDPEPVVGCPPDIEVYADPGENSAVVDWVEPFATDNCTVVSLTSTHNPGDSFPVGTTTVSYTATDQCGNTASCSFDITVLEENGLQVAVELKNVHLDDGQVLQRCITFELWDCSQPTPTPTVVTKVLDFISDPPGPAGANALGTAVFPVPIGGYSCITARDHLHTLRRTDSDDFATVGALYVADFTDKSALGGDDDSLIGGNLNDDQWVDILDYGVFTFQYNTIFGSPPSGDTDCSTPAPHADISANGVVLVEDFTFIQVNFWEAHEPNCCGQPALAIDGRDGPLSRVRVSDLHLYDLEYLAETDLNGDGWLDTTDMALFMQGVRPNRTPKALSNEAPRREGPGQ